MGVPASKTGTWGSSSNGGAGQAFLGLLGVRVVVSKTGFKRTVGSHGYRSRLASWGHLVWVSGAGSKGIMR